jgi:ribonuclease HI
MPFRVDVYVDGACRNNGSSSAQAAAAAIVKRWSAGDKTHTEILGNYYTPTNQRAELRAIGIALEEARNLYDQHQYPQPKMILRNYSDSKYAVNCMTTWQFKWRKNGWTTSARNNVVNQDLIKRACDLEDEVKRDCNAKIKYIWIPRADNKEADTACNDALDDADSGDWDDSDDWDY